jgi:cell division protein FtsQ
MRRCLLSLKIILLVGGMAGTSLLLILAYDAVTQSSYFEARTITVEGNQRYSKETILKQAGLKLHDNILSLNLHTLRCKLMAHPWIAAAEVERELPDAVHIQVRERVPIAIVDLNQPTHLASESRPAIARPAFLQSGARRTGQERAGVVSRLFYLDEEGEILKPVESSDKVRVPVVTGLALSDIDFNDQSRSLLFRAVIEALRLSRLHQNIIPLNALYSIHVDREVGLTLYAFLAPCNLPATPDGEPIFASKADRRTQADGGAVAIKVGFGDYGQKYRRLRDMIPYLKKETGFLNLQSIDLNDSDRVVVRRSLTGQAVRRAVTEGWDLWPSRRKGV